MKTLLLLLLLPLALFSQRIDQLWMMGYGSFHGPTVGGIDMNFISAAPVISYVSRPMNFGESSATMCDHNGNTLFYTNGVYIANATGDTMMNGSGLSPSYYTEQVGSMGLFFGQSVLILPDPGDPQKYYLIHGTIDDSLYYAYFAYHSVIDMQLDSGRGAVVTKNNAFHFGRFIPGRFTATKHGNGRDWWLIIHKAFDNGKIVYLLDPTGLHEVNSSPQYIGSSMVDDKGQACFSPDGKRFAQYGTINGLDIFDFDRCTGMFSNFIHDTIQDVVGTAGAGGVSFSPNSDVLYVSSTDRVFQYDLTAADIPSSRLTVAVWDTFFSPNPPFASTFYLHQLAPDGKIYILSPNTTVDMHVINSPDNIGPACDVCQHCVHLPAYNGNIPNYPNYYLSSLPNSSCDSLALHVSTSARKEMNVFPNPASDVLYISNAESLNEQGVSIVNSLGAELFFSSTTINNGEYLQLTISTLSPGIYFLKINSSTGSTTRKFVKQ